MTSLPRRSGNSGQETRDALADVMRAEEDRRRRSEAAEAAARPKDRTPRLWALSAGLALVALWFWLAPPGFLAPDPLAPDAEQLVTGLRMEVYVTALAIEAYRRERGELPGSLDDLDEPVETEVTYQTLGGGRYRLIGRLDGVPEVRWTSDESWESLLGRRPGGTLAVPE